MPEAPNTKLERLNHAYKKAVAKILLEMYPEQAVIVTDVLLDASLKAGRVWLRAPAEQIKGIEKSRFEIQNSLKEHVRSRFTPKLTFLQEDNYLESMDKLFDQLKDQ